VCASAQGVNPSPVSLGGSGSEGPHTISPLADQDYFVIVFAGNDTCSYHPKIDLNDSSGALRMDVTSDCASGPMACGEGGDATATTHWEFGFSDVCGSNQPIDPAKQAAPPAFYVRVYATASPNQCLTYSLTFSN
jgi:hypothetical protein